MKKRSSESCANIHFLINLKNNWTTILIISPIPIVNKKVIKPAKSFHPSILLLNMIYIAINPIAIPALKMIKDTFCLNKNKMADMLPKIADRIV